MKAKKGEQIQEALLIKNFRIRRLDDKNIVIERFVQPTKNPNRVTEDWQILGYYGKFEDMFSALLKYLVDIPHSDSLDDQLVLLNQNINKARMAFLDLVKINVPHSSEATGQSSKDSD